MSQNIPDDLIYAAFFFVDIVGLSNPVLSTETQRTKIKILNEKIFNSPTFTSFPKDDLFVLPTGDGMIIGFKDGLIEPITLSQDLHKSLNEYNSHATSSEKIEVRIGCNIGHIFVVKDVFGHINLWGPGAIIARRAMDLGDSNHILITSNMADDLCDLSNSYQKILHPLNDYKIKHDEEILLYSVYDQNFGNPALPTKTLDHSFSPSDSLKLDKSAICNKIIFNIKAPEHNKTQHERIYYINNQSSEPIFEINIGILTNTPKKFDELNVRAFDENNDSVKISKLTSHSPHTKEIVFKLTTPVFHGDSNRCIKVYYELDEHATCFENLFQTNTKHFELNLITPTDFKKPGPQLYHIDSNSHIKNSIEPSKQITHGLSTTIQWTKTDGINLEDLIRLEW